MIDFGVAKATEQRLTEKTVFTNFGQMLGAPAYMRPEQAVSEIDVDIQHHLSDKPIEAVALSMLYKMRRFVRRNKGPVSIAAVIALLLICGTVISSWQAMHATRAQGFCL